LGDHGSGDELVICVHGTFAADKRQQDTGHRWWQRGSDTWQKLAEGLPDGVTLPAENMQLFHWSGENSQVARLKASNRLLALLLDLERQGRVYHLVGHSHGGSVIWEALITAELMRRQHSVYGALRPHLRRRGLIPQRVPRRRRARTGSPASKSYYKRLGSAPELAGLRSWITVGTPFIQYLPKKHLLGDGWPGDKYSLARFPRENSVLEPVLAVLGLIFLFGAIISGLVLPFATSKDTGARMVPVGDIPMLIFLAVVTLIFMSFTLAASSRLEKPAL